MPKRKDIKRILVIGAGPIIIGQACEFDYSGVQACKALKEEGIKVILVNSNPATIMTDPDMADKIYIEPIHWRNIEKIIIKEKPDAILPTMGGQTALNTTLDLKGCLQEYLSGCPLVQPRLRLNTGIFFRAPRRNFPDQRSPTTTLDSWAVCCRSLLESKNYRWVKIYRHFQ